MGLGKNVVDKILNGNVKQTQDEYCPETERGFYCTDNVPLNQKITSLTKEDIQNKIRKIL